MSKRAKFNRDEVVVKAKDLYWEKGYHGTSMRSLQDAINMRPGSIYATFGSKDNLFIEAIDQYALEGDLLLQRCMDESSSNIDGLKRFLRIILIDRRDSAPSGMCMIIKSVAELTESDNPELLAHTKKLFSNIEANFAKICQSAIEAGEIDAEKDSFELARYIQIQIIGLRTFVRATDEIEVVGKFIEDIFEGAPFQ